MTFQWSHYCHLAQCLHTGKLEGANEEARHRSAISRAYYSAFCSARNYRELRTGSKLPQDWAAHRAVQEWFESKRDASCRIVAGHLAMLWEKRRQADYDDVPRKLNPAKDSAFCILLAEQVLAKLQELATAPG